MHPRDRTPFGRTDLLWLFVISTLGFALRLAYAWQLSRHPYGRFPWVDENAYWTWALAIRDGQWLPRRPFYQDPLFAYLLAGLMGLVGTSFAALRIALACLGSLTPPAVFWAGRIGLGRAEGIVAGLIVALYRPSIFNDGLLEKEGIGALVAALALGWTARAARPEATRRRGVWAGLAGAAWGVLSLLRANALLLGPLGVLWCARSCSDGTRRGAREGLLFAAGFGLALAPAMAINTVVADPPELLLTTWQAGANFYIGNGPEAEGNYTKLPFVVDNPLYEADDFRAEAQRRTGRRLSPGEVSSFWLREGLRRWQSAPAASLRLLGWKLALVASDFEIFDNQSEELVRLVIAPALGWGLLSFGWVLPWAALGLSRDRPGRTPFWWFLVLSTLGGLLSTAAFFVVGRYRVPWAPGLALLAAAGLVDTVRRLHARKWRALAWRLGVLALPAAALAWAPTAETLTPGRWALFYLKMFTAYESAGQIDDALDAIDDGRALDPRTARAFEASMNGFVARPQKQRIAAELARRIAVDRTRGDPASRLGLIRWLRVLPEEAPRGECLRLLEEALADHPDDPQLRRELGAWWLGQWRDPRARTKARAALERAARGPAADAGAAVLLALLSGETRSLDHPGTGRTLHSSPRVRMARAALIAHRLRDGGRPPR
jgi:hypothetical protein